MLSPRLGFRPHLRRYSSGHWIAKMLLVCPGWSWSAVSGQTGTNPSECRWGTNDQQPVAWVCRGSRGLLVTLYATGRQCRKWSTDWGTFASKRSLGPWFPDQCKKVIGRSGQSCNVNKRLHVQAPECGRALLDVLIFTLLTHHAVARNSKRALSSYSVPPDPSTEKAQCCAHCKGEVLEAILSI